MSEDAWKHRSVGMRCNTCMWFVPKTTVIPGTLDTPDPAYDLGRCRRHAPTINGYPVVFVNDWCGDHRLDETKWTASVAGIGSGESTFRSSPSLK